MSLLEGTEGSRAGKKGYLSLEFLYKQGLQPKLQRHKSTKDGTFDGVLLIVAIRRHYRLECTVQGGVFGGDI